ncbi:MAG: Peptidyl-tRNA hydrolase [Candidatus Bipolaricaulis sibiricus]|uniref:Peptidyl-tRNA hydrolase n=1 Tax=Bipolaricaulis sibiricus TaxID=2501609 RepID=A0A410FWN3_BIPS1|nr:MAG: Peptidyl-tRNA hydrolase [Candidatus Bipolaricaulis sibiricus]
MRAVVGLGNVGPEYAASRHNVGFWVVERLIGRGGWKRRVQPWGEVYRSSAGYLLRPSTYMNRSGDAVRELLAQGSLTPQDLLVVYDEADLPVGALRLRPGGGPGTHRGMKSVLAALGTDDVPRLRVGIGRPADGGDWVDHVLSPPPREEVEALARAVDWASELAWEFLQSGIVGALDRFSRETRGPDRII